jgi:hypothetical protein
MIRKLLKKLLEITKDPMHSHVVGSRLEIYESLAKEAEAELAKPEYQLSDDGLETLGDFLELIKVADDKDVTKGLCQELVLRAYYAGKNNSIAK